MQLLSCQKENRIKTRICTPCEPALEITLNAASIAHHRGLQNPMIQPVGLHYRCHHWFRTDIYVEFENPTHLWLEMRRLITE